MKDKSKIVSIVLVIITIIVIVISLVSKKNENIDSNEVKIVTNYSNFYTVNSCLYRATNYISTNDSSNLYLLLDEAYKNENNIKEDNVVSLFEKIEQDSTFVSRQMYYETVNSNVTKYYVKGYIEKNQIFNDDEIRKLDRKEIYIIVYLDSLNKTFSIEPYDGELFKKGDAYEG